MIGDDVAAALPELRAHAESLMRDSCIVRSASTGEPDWDPERGEYVTPPGPIVYAGRCQLPRTYPAAQDVNAGQAAWATGIVNVRLPARILAGDTGDPLAVADGNEVEITSRPGLSMTVRFVIPQTFEKSRDVSCEVTSRDDS